MSTSEERDAFMKQEAGKLASQHLTPESQPVSNEEYNNRLFCLFQANAEWPYKSVPVLDVADGAKSIGVWCKALMDAYLPLRRRLEVLPPIAEPARGRWMAQNQLEQLKPAELADVPRDHYAGSAGQPDQPMALEAKPEPVGDYSYENIATIFKMELREILERAREGTQVAQDKNLFQYLLSCIEPPQLPNHAFPEEPF
jgi:hypothetical protein